MRVLTGHDVPTGRRPGVTQQPYSYDWASADFMLTDLPGFGFMEGVPEQRREHLKTAVIRYLEDQAAADRLRAAILVVDGNSAVEIIDRHTDAGDVPHVIEFYRFFEDIEVPVVVAVNKMDKVDHRDEMLDALCERLGLYPPWQQWQDTIAPITAKRGAITPLTTAMRTILKTQGRQDLFEFF